MNHLINKSLLFLMIMSFYIPLIDNPYRIVPILITVILSAFLSYTDNTRTIICTTLSYLVLCYLYPSYLFFLPLIGYDMFLPKTNGLWPLCYLPILFVTPDVSFNQWSTSAFILLAVLLKNRTLDLQLSEENYHQLRDTAKEISMRLKKQNNELLIKQDSEITLATMTERNRIARDIHDNVGHLLSRSILQIGALLTLTKETTTREHLEPIKTTLSEAMNSIRTSVHNLYDSAIDLPLEINHLLKNFDACSVKLEYDIEAPLDKNIKYCFISVIKEALSNIIKHSDATEAHILLREHPAIYQLIIQDNGSPSSFISEEGIGIKNMVDRVQGIGGHLNIHRDKGFRIFISIPKKQLLRKDGLE